MWKMAFNLVFLGENVLGNFPKKQNQPSIKLKFP
jgi:hypothetical protein